MSRRFDDHTRRQLKTMPAGTTVIVPLGSTEQHGDYLPVSTDTTIVKNIVRRAVDLLPSEDSVLIAPPLPIGHAEHHLPFGGTISIGMSTYHSLLVDIGRSLAIDGFTSIMFINGHGGNDAPMRTAIDQLVSEDRLEIDVAGLSYWNVLSDQLPELSSRIGPFPGHAGSFETSCMLALGFSPTPGREFDASGDGLRPLAAVPLPGAELRRHGLWEASGGITDDAHNASAAHGVELIDLIAVKLAGYLTAFHNLDKESAQ